VKPPEDHDPTDIWAVTYHATTQDPYAFVRATNCFGAMEKANAHPEVCYRATRDSGYSIHRLTRGQVKTELRKVITFPPDCPLSEHSRTQALNAYLTSPDIPTDPTEALSALRSSSHLPLPHLRLSATPTASSTPILVRTFPCPEQELQEPIGWAINHIKAALYEHPTLRPENFTPMFFTCAELSVIAHAIRESTNPANIADIANATEAKERHMQ
jgi:hypothetical protein